MVPVKTVFASRPGWKMTPGERTSWETTTRSVPLMMKVPLSVMTGKSPMKTVCSLISPVLAFMKRARTNTGAAYVMSFSLHSSTENFGCGRRSTSPGSNSSSKLSWPVKSSMGLMSENASASPRSRNQRNESRWTETRSGRASTSSRLAKENRSGLRELEYNDVSLPDVKVGRDRSRNYGYGNSRPGQPWDTAADRVGHRVGHEP